MFNELSHQTLIRPGSSSGGATVTARESADFHVDGKSLLRTLTLADGGHSDFMGAFVKGYPDINVDVAKQLCAQSDPFSATGRVLLYVCPECGDIACGAYSTKVSMSSGAVSWTEFAYENGYENARLLERVGPFTFEASQYEAAIALASAL